MFNIFFLRSYGIDEIEIGFADQWPRVFRKVVLCFLLLFLSFGSAFAEHEPDHRYLVSGYVRDEVGVPIPNANVALEHKGGEKKKATTNSDGYFEVRFHLHNTNHGDEILVTVGEKSKRHKVEFDPEDGLTFRGGQVDFGAPGKEGAKGWIFLTAASLAVMAFVIYRLLFQKGHAEQKNESGRKGKRTKKKKK